MYYIEREADRLYSSPLSSPSGLSLILTPNMLRTTYSHLCSPVNPPLAFWLYVVSTPNFKKFPVRRKQVARVNSTASQLNPHGVS